MTDERIESPNAATPKPDTFSGRWAVGLGIAAAFATYLLLFINSSLVDDRDGLQPGVVLPLLTAMLLASALERTGPKRALLAALLALGTFLAVAAGVFALLMVYWGSQGRFS